MRKKRGNRYIFYLRKGWTAIAIPALVVSLLSAVGCNTGIESTKKIQLTKEEKKSLRLTKEDEYLSKIESSLLKDWKKGKRFLASDVKTALIFDQAGLPADFNNAELAGKILEYDRIESSPMLDGRNEAVIVFKEKVHDGKEGREFRYRTGKEMAKAMETFKTTDVPLTIDIDMVAGIAELLEGKDFWIKTPLWYDAGENKINGRKFVKVRVEHVSPGNMVFPVAVQFIDEKGERAYVYMNYGHRGMESRSFPALFSLSDVKLSYPTVSDEMWNLIQQGKVARGMTKLECRLSLGNPKEVSSGHDWNNTMDIWQYTDGIFLRFRDGILYDYRR